jgi:hypothetical protein
MFKTVNIVSGLHLVGLACLNVIQGDSGDFYVFTSVNNVSIWQRPAAN